MVLKIFCVVSIVYFLFDYCLNKPESIRLPLTNGIFKMFLQTYL